MNADQKRQWKAIISVIVIVLAVGFIIWRYVYMPAVGEKKAKELFQRADVSPEKMAQIKNGMTEAQVQAITGEPIGKTTLKDGSVRWDWIAVMVLFKDGKVTYAGSTRIRRLSPGAAPGTSGEPPPGG